MINLCFVIDNLSNSNYRYKLLTHIGKCEHNDLSIAIMYKNPSLEIMTPSCFASNIASLSEFEGVAVASNLDCASIVNKSTSKVDKWLYLDNLDWLYSVINYEYCINMLKNFTIVAKSKSYMDNIVNFTGRNDILLAENFKELEELIRAKCK